MVSVKLFSRDGILCGFRMVGHAGGQAGRDIVCAAISSAALMAANTVTEIYGCRAVTRMRDGYLLLTLPTGQEEAASGVLEGLRLHLCKLQRQYPRQLYLDLLEL